MAGDLFNKLKSLFIIEEDIPSKKKKEPVSQVPPQEEKKPVTFRLENTPENGQVEQKYLDILFKALESNNLDGFDYLEFKEALQSLESVDMDDATRVKSALAVSKTMGADVDSLISSAQGYLTVLTEEEKKFQEALNDQVEEKLSARSQAIKEMEADIATKKNEIVQLQEQIHVLETETEQKEKELAQAKTKLENVHDDFDTSYDFLVDQIQKDIQLLKQVKSES